MTSEQALDRVFQQTPEVYAEIVRWGIISNVMGVVICSMIIAVLTWVSVRCFRTNKKDESIISDKSLASLGFGLVAAIIALVFCIGFLASISELTQVLCTPKAYVAEFLIRKMK